MELIAAIDGKPELTIGKGTNQHQHVPSNPSDLQSSSHDTATHHSRVQYMLRRRHDSTT
jgi:hypothetical protein